jgi:hypothetical protein
MTTAIDRDLVRRLRAPAYSLLAVTLLFQLFDYASALLPLRPTAAAWRFVAFGSASNIVGNALLLLLLIYALSLFAADGHVMQFVAILALFLALFLLGGAPLLVLDGLRLRSKMQATSLSKFDLATAQTLIKLIVEGIISALLAVSAFRARAAANRSAARHVRQSDAPLIARLPVAKAP